MSILQEYEQIRKDIGEKKFYEIERFLKYHSDLYLSDVYYKSEVFNEMEKWCITYPLEKFITNPRELTAEFMLTINEETKKYGLDIGMLVQQFMYVVLIAPENITADQFVRRVMDWIDLKEIPLSVTQNDIGVFIQQRKYA